MCPETKSRTATNRMSEQSSDMTLALTVEALRRLDEPATAVADARDWTVHLGVVAEKPNAGLEYASIQQIETEFFSGTRSIEETLSELSMSYDTDRFVLVGTTDSEEELATAFDWEYRDIETAAERAGWTLAEREKQGGILDRLLPF